MTQIVTYVEIDVPRFDTPSASPEETETFRFAVPSTFLPSDISAIPIIDNVNFTPARISLGKDLGQRASVSITLRDIKHIFNGEPYDQGTFWGKWRGRYGTKLRGRPLRLIRGVVGQAIEDMDIRHYLIETTDGPTFDATYTIEAKDILKFADDDRAQVPSLSNGSLAGSIDNAVTSFTVTPTGIGDLEYPASGWVCLSGSEVVSFTRSGDDFTITRAQLGTVAQSHDSGDRVQLVKRYTGDDVADIIYDLLVNFAGVDPSYISLTEWQAETADHLGVIYARTITDPMSVNEAISELISQAALALWWDDRAKMIRLNVLREISTDTATFGDKQIIDGTLQVEEQPDTRISQIWTLYGRKNPTDSAGKKENFRSVEADADLDREAEYGSAAISTTNAKWLETQTSAQRHNQIQLSRFRDPPRKFGFDLFRDQVVTPAAGYKLQYWGSQDASGVQQDILIQVTQVRIDPDKIHVEAEEMLASGVIVLTNVIFLLATDGGVDQWEVPADWNNVDNSIALIGAGGGGGRNAGFPGQGAGGGAFSRSTNVNFASSPPDIVNYRVGLGGAGAVGSADGQDGGDTVFDGTTLGACTVGAEGGEGGSGAVNQFSAGQGGSAANGTGDLKTSGGDGGDGSPSTARGGGGGGGAGGPNGDGADGGNGDGHARGGGGGGADGGFVGTFAQGGNNRFNFGGGAESQSGQEGGGGGGGSDGTNGGPGGAGEQLWTQTVSPIISAGSGGGGGGGGRNANNPGGGGNYGGGGGGAGETSNESGGDGADGIIIITWREAS